MTRPMTVVGQSLPKWDFAGMSAFLPIANQLRTSLEVRLAPRLA